MRQKFSQTAIVIIKITRQNNSEEIKYVTIGNIGRELSESELKEEALSYLADEQGSKAVVSVMSANSEQYRQFLENNIVNFARPKD